MKNQSINAPGISTITKMKKLRYISPAKFPTFRLIPKYTKAFTNLKENRLRYKDDQLTYRLVVLRSRFMPATISRRIINLIMDIFSQRSLNTKNYFSNSYCVARENQ